MTVTALEVLLRAEKGSLFYVVSMIEGKKIDLR
jgi:hypothetical protein